MRGHYLLNLDEMSLSEIVQHLNHEDYTTVASMVAYVERISEGKDSRVMADIRELGGVPAVIDLLGHPIPDIHHSAVNILWNMAYRQPNDDGNLAIKNAGGIPALIRLLRSTSDDDVKEIVTGTLWNLSSDEKLKTAILDDGLTVMVKTVIIPESGWPKNQDNDHDIRLRTTPFSVSFTNAAGCLRNISSAGLESRKKMRECEGLVDSCMYALRSVSGSQLHELLDCKAIEHCMCTIQNLSYHIGSEIFQQETTNSHTANIKDNQDFKIGCFSFGKKSSSPRDEIIPMETRNRKEPPRGKDLLWQPEVCRPYLSLLSECSNPDTLEAAAGTVQNLTASDSRWSVDICSDVRKSKGLPMFVELLKIDVDTVVNSVAKAMHNLCQDPRNKELIGE
ncbi:catenin delta-2-like [Saccoglossus kowalevskii]